MTNFNTQAAKIVATDLHTSFDIANAMVTFLNSNEVAGLSDFITRADLYNIMDTSARHGAYQVFSGGPTISLAINGNKVRVTKLPIIGKIVFTLTNKDGFTKTTTNVNAIKTFLTKLVKDEDNLRMFTK